MTPEAVFIIYFNLCAVALAGWLTTRRHGKISYGWRIFSLLSATTFVFLLVTGGLGLVVIVWLVLTFHGC